MERGGGGGRAHHTRGITGNGQGEPSEFLLQWGNRKRLRCVKIQVKASTTGNNKSTNRTTTVRVDRRVLRSDNKDKADPNVLLRRPSPMNRAPRRPEPAVAMKKTHQEQINGNQTTVSLEDKKMGDSCGLTSSGGSDDIAWPKFVISLSNREKEDDFMVFKGCNKLPQKPKKRTKCVQKTLNLVCPGSWLCDLTLERYEVREKKIIKKRPSGLKAMGSMDSDSE